MKQLLITLMLLVLIFGTARSSLAQTQAPQVPAPVVSEAQKRQDAFELVWKTVNERFYDPAFGGIDWKKVHQRYAPLIAASQNDQEAHQILQQMVSELHQSHFLIIPQEAIPKLIPRHEPQAGGDAEDADAEDEELAALGNDESISPLDRIGYKMTERLSTGIGIDLRVLNGAAVITRVEPASAAARAGLRPGFVIKSVSGQSLAAVIVRFQSNPAYQTMFRGELPVILLAALVNGQRQTSLKMVYLDGQNRLRSVRLEREKLKGEMSQAIGNLPAMYTEFEARQLPGGFGYIRFNAFVPNQMKRICAALRSMRAAPGLILDLRGNQGGLIGMISGLTGLLSDHFVVVGTMESRTGRNSIVAFPQRVPYAGALVVLIDGATQSAAEIFARGLQEAGRAVVVGQQSAGNALPSTIVKLPTGALFQYGFANYRTTMGARLEGAGVVPDITVALTRRALLTGSDPQLSAGLKTVREQAYWMRPPSATGANKELIAEVTVKENPTPPPNDRTVISVAVPPPPAPPKVVVPTRVVIEGEKTPDLLGLPTVDQILNHYLEATGGRAAFEKLTSRVSKGTVELPGTGLNARIEMYEEAPNKSSSLIDIDGLGTTQSTFDGITSWVQDPMQGYVKVEGAELQKREYDFRREQRLKELYPDLVVVGKEKVGERDAYVLQSPSAQRPGAARWFFDAESGLLLRENNLYYEDYRAVDGVKLPFTLRDDSGRGFGAVIHLDEIKHNVAIDQSKFAESPDCFTKPDGVWSKNK